VVRVLKMTIPVLKVLQELKVQLVNKGLKVRILDMEVQSVLKVLRV
jgi:hypothetical protein